VEKCGGEVKRVLLSTEGKLALVGLAIAAATLVSSSALGLSLGAPTCCAGILRHGCRSMARPKHSAEGRERGVSLVRPAIGGWDSSSS